MCQCMPMELRYLYISMDLHEKLTGDWVVEIIQVDNVGNVPS
mgnify:CR=1 FL=1